MNFQEKDIFISRTPNPKALKVAADFPFRKKGAGLTLAKETALDPFFAPFFDEIPGLCEIYVFDNQITLSFEREDFISEETGKQAEELIRRNLSFHNPDFEPPEEPPEEPLKEPLTKQATVAGEASAATSEGKTKPNKAKTLSPELQKIEDILDQTIRPGLQADGGDLQVISLKNNRLEIAYQGACGGCPSAFMGTLEAVENILQYETGNKDLSVCPV